MRVFWLSACVGACAHLCVRARGTCVRQRASCAALERSRPAEVTVKRWEQTLPSEEEGLAGRRQDIPSYEGCCAHILRLSPAGGSRKRSGGVKHAPPSVIILPSPAVLSVLTTELSPLCPHPSLQTPASALYGPRPLFILI